MNRTGRTLAFEAVVVCCALSVCACSTYSARRAALVPHSAPALRNGQPLDGQVEAAIGLSSFAQSEAPTENDPNVGLHIPAVQANGAFRVRTVAPNLDLGVVYERGFARGATSLASDQPTPRGDATAVGISAGYSIPTEQPGLRIGLSLDVLAYSIPVVRYLTCIENCPANGYSSVTHETESVHVAVLGIAPSYRHGWWTVFGSLSLRNHPTIERGGFVRGFDSEQVEEGPLNTIGAVGVTLNLPERVGLTVLLHQTLTGEPVRYSPSFAAALTIQLGAPAAKR